MRAAIGTGGADPAELRQRVLASPRMAGADLAREVSTAEPYQVSPPPAPGPVPGRRGGPGHQGRDSRGDGRPGLPGAGAARHGDGRGDPGHRPGRGVLLQRPRGPGRGRVRGRGDARRADRGRPCVRHLPRQPDPRPGARPGHLQAPVRAPGREPAGQGPGHRAGADHQPQPRLRGRAARRSPGPDARIASTRRSAGPRSAMSTSTTAWSRGSGCSTRPPSACSTTPRPRRARTTRRGSSTRSAR